MDAKGLDRIGTYVALGGAALTAIAFALGGWALGFGALVGAIVATGNWYAVRWLGRRILRATDQGKMMWTLILTAKMAAILGIVWLILSTGMVSPAGFAIGMGALLVGMLIAAFQSMREPRTSSTGED